MATRRSEWLASIKPILDRDEAKKDAAALAKELGDILEVKIDASPENLDELTKEFNAQLKTMGKQPIVFSEKTLSGIVSQFTRAIADGISKGVANVDFSAQLEKLNKKREDVAKKYEKANRLMASKTRYTNLERFEIQTAHTYKITNDIEKQAKQVVKGIYDAEKMISAARKEYGKDSVEYIDAVLDGQEAYNKYLRMQKTFSNKMSVAQKLEISPDVRAYFDRRNSKSDELEDFAFEHIGDPFEELSDMINISAGGVHKLKQELEQVDIEIKKITQSMSGAEVTSGSIIEDAKNGLKTLDEIQTAYSKLKKQGKNEVVLQDQNKKHIESATQYVPKENDGIKTFAQAYRNLETSDDWVERYHALLRYVKLYESYLESDNKTHRNRVTDPKDPYGYTELYKELKPKFENAQNMLQNILNLGEGKPLVGMGGVETEKAQDASTEAANAERIAEANKITANEKARAREEEEKAANALEQQKVNNEASVEAEKEALDLTKQRVQVLEQFDQEHRNKTKPGQRIETAAQLDSKTGAIDKFTVGDADGVKLPGSLIEDTEWGQQKPHLDTGLHTHWTDTAAPSPQDLKTFKERLNYQRLEIIRAMQEALFLDFSKISDEGLKQLIDEYARVAEQVQQQFESMPISERLKQFGSLDQHYEQMQVKLKEEFVKLVKDKPGFAEYVQKPMWSGEVTGGKSNKNATQSVIPKVSLDDIFANANEELKELIKNYAILNRNIGKNIGDESSFDQLDDIENKFENIAPELLDISSNQWQSFGEKVAIAEQAVDGLNESLEKTHQLTSGDNTSTGVGDTSSSELEAEKARVESLQSELDKKNSEVVEKDNEIQRIKLEKDSAIQAANDEKQTLQTDLDAVNKQNAELRERLSNDGDALWTAEQRANEAEARVAQLEKGLVESLDGGKKQGSVNSEELKTLLNSIVYNVKITHDDNDKTANKIALDDSTLESTLTKVFANILNPQTQQNYSEQKQTPWALESTLQTVKGALDNIQTNTSKIGIINTSNVDTIAGTALDSRLVEIKSVLDSINQKIVDGGKIFNRDGAKQAYKDSQQDATSKQTSQSNMFKSLQKDYESMGKLSAQFAAEENLETKAMLENLKQTIIRKREELKLTLEQNTALRKKYSIAFDAEKRLLDAAKAQEKINKQTRQQDRDDKAAWKKKVKDAQRATGINAATTAANAGDQTVVRAIGTEGVSKDIENKAKELSDNIKTLRVLRDEIDKKGEKASAEDRDNLSKQITKVKELKTEVDGYLKIHEKYSGEGVTDLGDASNFGAVGTDQYWNNITAAIKNASSGKTTIKGLNADTGELTGTTKIAANTFATWSATVDPLTGRLSMLRTGIKKTETLTEQITRKTKEIFTYFSGSSIIFKAFNMLKQGVQYIRDIDLALTELKKVTDETEETYDKFLQTAAKTGARLGATISAVTEATATFAKLGYSMEQASEMAEAAIVYKNVGDNIASTEDAADSIISTLKGFGLEASESMAIVDKFNEVGNRFAITSQGIGEALRLSASALNEGGNSLDESIAIITAANEVVNDPSSVGTALKTLTLRLRGAKTELEEAGLDVENMATTTSQLQAKLLALTGGQVDIMLDENTFKNSTQILREMATAWEDMNDIQRASALELMGGKRQANVLSALIQNFDTVEEAIEASANSSGSALKENERYLDSIQGKIDQFTNATQAMWSNFLDSDVIKFIVDLGTKLIKLIDKIGVIPSVLSGVLIYLTAFKKQNPLDWIQSITQYLHAFKGTDGLKQFLGQLLGIAPAMKIVTAETVANTVATQMNDAATAKDMMSKMGLATATGSLSIAQKEQAATSIFNAFTQGQLTQAQANAMLATLGYKTSLDGATWSLKALDTTTKSFMATNPIGWILAIVSVLMTVIMLLSQIPSGVERLTEKLTDLKSELSDLESEIDTLNSELETTQERMAELIALPSLSFVEQEELETLKQTTAELERQLQLKEMLADSKEDEVVATAEKYIDRVWDSEGLNKAYYVKDGKVHEDKGWGGFWNAGKNTKDILDSAIKGYETARLGYDKYQTVLSQWDDDNAVANKELLKRYGMNENASKDAIEEQIERYDNLMTNNAAGINMIFSDENFDGLKYGMSDEIDTFLDEMYAYQLKWRQAQGEHVKSDAISSMFDATSTKEMQKFGKSLQEIADSDLTDEQKNAEILKQLDGIDGTLGDGVNNIDGATDAYNRLHLAMDTVGVTAQDIADYFVLETGAFDSSTAEGIINQYNAAKTALDDLKSGAINLDDLVKYDPEKNEATGRVDKIAEQLKGVSPEIREQFTSIVEAVKEGTMDYEAAIKKLELQSMQSVISLAKTELESANKLAFPDLEVSGWIDSVDELQGAFESLASAMDLIVTAQEQMNSSGRISMKTALDLMAATDDWNQILEVNNGVITMNANAEQILIQSKLDLIKANIEMALQQVETDIALMEGAINSTKAGNAFTQGFTKALKNAQGVLVGLKAGWDAFWAGEDVSSAFNNAYKSTVDNLTPDESSLSDLYAQRDKLQKQRDMLTSVDTTQEFKDNYDFDKTPGDKYDDEGAEDDAFQREVDYWENRIAANQAKYEQIQNEIDLLEAKGQKADTSFYEEQIQLENERKWLLEQQKAEAQAFLGTLEEGSEEWWEVANTLNDIEGELDDVTASIVDLQDAIGEIDTYKFEEFNTRLDNLTSKLETIRNLIAPDGEENWFDDEGDWTEEGVAVLGSYLQELETYKQGYAETVDELNKYAASYEGNEAYYETLGIHSEQEWYDKTEELISQQYDFAESISDTEQSVVDMYESSIDAVEEYVDTLIDGYNDYIDSVKEALDAERDLYDFKKNVQKQAKDIAEIERRIMSLSGSTNAADIAERRRLEADLYGAREELDDTYYDHAKDSQQNALDAEAEAYEEQMTKFIEGLRTSLDEATANMDEFLMGVTSMVMYNADTVLAKYEETNLPLTKELTNPWEEAQKAVGSYSGNALDLMNQWTKEGGFFAQFNASGTTNLKFPWSAGSAAATSFKNSVSSAMTDIANSVRSNVSNITSYLGSVQSAYNGIISTAIRAKSEVEAANAAAASGASYTGSAGNTQPTSTTPAHVDNRILNKYKLTASQVLALGYGPISLEEFERLLKTYQIKYSAAYATKQVANTTALERSLKKVLSGNYVTGPWAIGQYAKGTTGVDEDQLAIVDELGPELIMHANPETGRLEYLTKGSSVIPHDATTELMKLVDIGVDGLMMPKFDSGVNMMTNYITKPEFKIDIEEFVHVDRVDQDTLPKLEAMMDKKINDFGKALNYSIKRFAR